MFRNPRGRHQFPCSVEESLVGSVEAKVLSFTLPSRNKKGQMTDFADLNLVSCRFSLGLVLRRPPSSMMDHHIYRQANWILLVN